MSSVAPVDPTNGDKKAKKFNETGKEGIFSLSNEENIDYSFASETSLHGVGLIASAKNRLIKVIWTAIFLALSGVLVWQVIVLFTDFLEYTPVTEVKIEVYQQFLV